MPIHWREDAKGRWPILVYSDPYTVAELDKTMHELLAHRIAAPPLRLLVDRRNCTAPSRAFVEHIANFIESRPNQYAGGRIALVTGDQAGFGAARMTEIVVSLRSVSCEMQVFRDWQEAERWLDAQRSRA